MASHRILAASLLPLTLGAEIRFERDVYPILQAAQCAGCHHDNGVASATRLRFPAEDAPPSVIEQFGRSLTALVDRAAPEKSRLVQMPTNRAPHPGGERIKRGSPEEQTWLAWTRELARGASSSAAAAEIRKELPSVLRRLTHTQYNNTVAVLLEDRTQPARQFPAEDFVHGFTNQADSQSISPLLAEDYSRAAAKLALNAARSGVLKKLLACQAAQNCGARFIEDFGVRAFRRPLTPGETAAFLRLFERESARADPVAGAQIVVQAMLSSPSFLFRAEAGEYATASRLSYLLWNAPPPAWLVREAAARRLGSREQVEAAARRLMQDPLARPAVTEFASQWLRFDRVRGALRERKLFPEFGPELIAGMIEETSRFFQHLVWENRDFREFFTADYTFANASVAELYGAAPPERDFAMIRFPPDSKRAGILGHASFLTLTSKPEETSPTERGLFVREHFLCQIVPPPPAGVTTTLPAIMEDKPMSNRDRLSIHLSNPACSSCHKLVDSIGFGFEQFDAIGRFREKQISLVYPVLDKVKKNTRREGVLVALPVDTAASIVGIKGSEFTSPVEAGRILANDPACQRCVVKQFFRFALGRQETESDQPFIDAALERWRGSGYRFQELILGVVTSDSFLKEGKHAQ